MRWAGKLGITQQTEVKPGIWDDVIIEVPAKGDLVQRTEALDSGSSVLPQYRTTTSVSVLSTGLPPRSMVYLTLSGDRRAISSAVYQHPRLVLYVGEVYHGPIAGGTPE